MRLLPALVSQQQGSSEGVRGVPGERRLVEQHEPAGLDAFKTTSMDRLVGCRADCPVHGVKG